MPPGLMAGGRKPLGLRSLSFVPAGSSSVAIPPSTVAGDVIVLMASREDGTSIPVASGFTNLVNMRVGDSDSSRAGRIMFRLADATDAGGGDRQCAIGRSSSRGRLRCSRPVARGGCRSLVFIWDRLHHDQRRAGSIYRRGNVRRPVCRYWRHHQPHRLPSMGGVSLLPRGGSCGSLPSLDGVELLRDRRR